MRQVSDDQQEPTADQAWQYARQIVCEEWQRAVKQYGLLPGSLAETIVSQIVNRLDTHRFEKLTTTVSVSRPFLRLDPSTGNVVQIFRIGDGT